MKQIHNIIKELRQNNSSNYKLEVLIKHKDNIVLQEFLKYTYHPRMMYYIKKFDMPNSGSREIEADEFFHIFYTLNSRIITGNEAMEFLQNNLRGLIPEIQELVELVLSKDIKSNVSVKSINKVWKDLIPTTPYMRCSKVSEVSLEDLFEKHNSLFVQKKADGVFSYIIKQNDKVSLITRQGQVWSSPTISYEMEDFPNGYILVGEALIKENGKELDRKTGNGLINSLIKKEQSLETLLDKINNAKTEASRIKLKAQYTDKQDEYDGIDSKLHFEVWDLLTVEEFDKGFSKVGYEARLKTLQDILVEYQPTNIIKMIDTFLVHSNEKIEEYYSNYISQGLEGVVVKTPTMLFENKTSKEQIKIKEEKDCDLLCIGIEEGTGKYSGKIGSLICQSSCGRLKVNVGTGLTDMDREKSPDEYIGKIIAIKYNEIITNETDKGVKSLFLPVFIEVRLDKVVADSLEEIE